MNITVLQENLLKALTRTGRIVSPKSQLPIAQHALLEAKDGRLRVVTTNLETAEETWVGAKVKKDGALCVPSKLLSELIASFPQDAVEFVVAEGSLVVDCAGFHATLPGMGAAEFPPLPDKGKSKGATLPKEQIVTALARVLFSAAADEGRPILTGVRFVGRGKDARIAATDGYRLSVVRVDLTGGADLNLVVPARALAEVVKIAHEEKELDAVELLQLSDSQLAFVLGDTTVYTRLIDGEYPNFDKIIPTTHLTRATIDMQKLLRAVKSAAIFARDSANIIRFHIENGTLTVSANTPQVGENRIDIEANVEGDGGDIAFNSRFLLEFLANVVGEEIVFEMTGALNPGVFRLAGDEGSLHIIMPVRVSAG